MHVAQSLSALRSETREVCGPGKWVAATLPTECALTPVFHEVA
jgi:hypothetical protein